MWMLIHTGHAYKHRGLVLITVNERNDLVGGKMNMRKSILKVHAFSKESKQNLISMHVKLISFHTLKGHGKNSI